MFLKEYLQSFELITHFVSHRQSFFVKGMAHFKKKNQMKKRRKKGLPKEGKKEK